MIWFTADTHFGDHRPLALARRPFADVVAMDAGLVANWNARVGPDDEVWHLGDVARAPTDVPALLARLHGRKHLIAGNNDPDNTRAAGWASVADYAELEVDGQALVLCHYPFRSWRGQHRRAIDLHRHSHGRLKPLPRQFDVGVDARGLCAGDAGRAAGAEPAGGVGRRAKERAHGGYVGGGNDGGRGARRPRPDRQARAGDGRIGGAGRGDRARAGGARRRGGGRGA